jgi:hypothetical protein
MCGGGAGRSAFGEEPGDLLGRDLALAAGAASRPELPVSLPPTERLHPDADELRRLSDPIGLDHESEHTESWCRQARET